MRLRVDVGDALQDAVAPGCLLRVDVQGRRRLKEFVEPLRLVGRQLELDPVLEDSPYFLGSSKKLSEIERPLKTSSSLSPTTCST